jgi:pantoate--beta-alanine ligase
MKVFSNKKELAEYLSSKRKEGNKIGFIPTMGALHEGHLSLIRACASQDFLPVASVFVNPAQFNDLKDLAGYPKTIEQDKTMLKSAGCEALFLPSIDEIYPEGLPRDKSPTEFAEELFRRELAGFNPGALETVLEGAFRPGHFRGVAVVVNRLFQIVRPEAAFFGQKDFQQLAIIKEMVRQTEMKIEIVSCPTERESDGLAMSSRNTRLSSEERKAAPLISRTLFQAKADASKGLSVQEIRQKAIAALKKEPLFELEYFELADAKTLLPVQEAKPGTVACTALKVGAVRLIDNIIL